MLFSLGRLISIIIVPILLVYRKFLSPRKGYSCACAALLNQPSCSDVALAELVHEPIQTAYPVIKTQLAKCKAIMNQANLDNIDGEFVRLAGELYDTNGMVRIAACEPRIDPP